MPRLAQNHDCTGCMACYYTCNHEAIEITTDSEGFKVPIVKENNCVDCKLCEKSCPIVTILEPNIVSPSVFAVWHGKDRKVSSSGGAFSALARKTLERGGVVFGAAFDENLHLKHIAVTNLKGLAALRGSKYVQSDVGDSFKKVKLYLKEGREVFFCGTPCQIAGLRGYLRKDYENLLMADLVCHGVPSDDIFQSYLIKLKKRSIKAKEIESFEFRRRDGWGISPSIITANNYRTLYGVDALYMEAFDKNATFRESCYHCQFARIPRVGDVTLADFWGIGRHGKKFKHNVMKGVSLVLVNNNRGESAMADLDEDTFIEERTLGEALIENHNLTGASKRHPYRNEIIQDFLNDRMSLTDIDKKYHMVDHSMKGFVRMWSLKLGVFEMVKMVYNWYRSL